jgi:NADH:ubiquinone oxidoreductase subunit 6 (subunit J)
VVSIGAIDVLFLFVLMIFKYQNKKSFFQIFGGMTPRYFSRKSAI